MQTEVGLCSHSLLHIFWRYLLFSSGNELCFVWTILKCGCPIASGGNSAISQFLLSYSLIVIGCLVFSLKESECGVSEYQFCVDLEGSKVTWELTLKKVRSSELTDTSRLCYLLAETFPTVWQRSVLFML